VDQTCSQASISAGKTFQISTYVYISDCLTLADTILSYKPVGVCGGIDDKWNSYKSGVISNCGGTNIGGHCVLLVGASSDSTTNSATNWWKVRNSWGTSYGESGFMRLYRDKSVTTGGFCGFCGGAIYSQ
jgi:cathepsin L